MLDDQVIVQMEKKCSPCVIPCKSNGSETKNGNKLQQDGATKFPQHKTPKRRESSCESAGCSSASRKPTPQRCRNYTDKRPRPRGGHYFDRDRSEVADTLVDTGVINSAVKQGSKKVSLSHLLNFSFAPRSGAENNWSAASGSNSRSKCRVKLPKYNKERFLLANCQFVVHDGGNYEVHAADPDVLVEWAHIEEIHLSSFETPLCPICLYPPIAAKITCCGHIYCWSCILHYLALSDKTWRKCPICYDAVYEKDLKSVRITVKTNHKVGDEITMYLMQRVKGSAIPVPVLHWNGPPEKPFHLTDESTMTGFQKVLVATNDDVYNIIQREKEELDYQLSQEQDNPESCFISSAQKLLQKRMDKLELEKSCSELCQSLDATVLEVAASEVNDKEEAMIDYFDGDQVPVLEREMPQNARERCISSSTDSSFGLAEVVPEDLEPVLDEAGGSECNESAKKVTPKGYYYFYQACDGQHIYLHALNVKMLIMEYGSLENCPPVLTAKIVERERTSMTESLRKRLRYLQHLPLTCEFEVVELKFEPPLISVNTARAFNEDVEKRQRQRNRRAREEREREKEIEVQVNYKLGKYPASEYCLDSLLQFPMFGESPSDANPLDMQPSSSSNSVSSPEGPVTSPASDSPEDQGTSKQTSFAQMLREGNAKPWTVGSSQTVACDTSSPELKTVKGKESPDLDDDDEDYVPPPTYQQSFSEAIQAALDNAVQQKETTGGNSNGCGKKKKKGKKTVLFSTNMNRKN